MSSMGGILDDILDEVLSAVKVLLHPVSVTKVSDDKIIYEIGIIRDCFTWEDMNFSIFFDKYRAYIEEILGGYITRIEPSKDKKYFIINIRPYPVKKGAKK